MMRMAVAALAAIVASAADFEKDISKDLNSEPLERRLNLADRHQKGSENEKRASLKTLTNEQKQKMKHGRMLKRQGLNEPDSDIEGATADSGAQEEGEGEKKGRGRGGKRAASDAPVTATGGHDLHNVVLTAARTGHTSTSAYAKAGKDTTKAPSNGGPSAPTIGGGRAPKTDKGYNYGGKSRKGPSICQKRLDIAFELITKLGPNGPFGMIDEPSDVTELCGFFPPMENDPTNFGCPLLYTPDIGFFQGDDYVNELGEEPGMAFESLVLYCQCYSGYEQGCAAKIPHGPPTYTMAYTDDAGQITKEVLVPSYSEYIPHSTPGERAEYCKMVGVWNGDFMDDAVMSFTEDVAECGCYFLGMAKEMVSQCPGVDLGAFFTYPAEPTAAPTPLVEDCDPSVVGADYCTSFEKGTFPDEDWEVYSGIITIPKTAETRTDKLKKADGEGNEEQIQQMIKEIRNSRKGGSGRRLQEDESDFSLTNETASHGDYSVVTPSEYETLGAYVGLELKVQDDWELPGFVHFSLKTDFNDDDEKWNLFDLLYWGVEPKDEGRFGFEAASKDWSKYRVYVDEGAELVWWEYLYNFLKYQDTPEKTGKVYIDEVYFMPTSTPIPTYEPTTYIPTFSPTFSPTLSPTLSPTTSPAGRPVEPAS